MAPSLHLAPSPFSDTFVHAVTRTAVAEPVFATLDLMFGLRGQGGLEEAVVVVVVVVVVVDDHHQVTVFVGE